MNAGELLKVLAAVPPETPVGRGGHFGELIELDGAYTSTSTTEDYRFGTEAWYDPDKRKVYPLVVLLEVPDVGEID